MFSLHRRTYPPPCTSFGVVLRLWSQTHCISAPQLLVWGSFTMTQWIQILSCEQTDLLLKTAELWSSFMSYGGTGCCLGDGPQWRSWVADRKTSGRCRWASTAHWEVFLFVFEQLFRQLVSRRTVQLSSYKLLMCLLLAPILLRCVSLASFVHWPVSWRLSDGHGLKVSESDECYRY